ncbi:MAG: type I methionyl aminopeptidase [Oscillospiraceae bacterium]|nr:type I methionyl aminopeptidase [Oscillospiraceae bacterium]
MIHIKSAAELEKMRVAGRISANALHYGGQCLKDGMSTYELDKLIHDYIVKNGATPSFLGLYGFKGSACISINDKVIHGVPSKKEFIKEGDIVSIDTGAYIDGFHGDNAYTFPVGKISEEAQLLLERVNASLYKGIEQARPGNRVGDISNAVETYCRGFGYGVVKTYTGHGVGAKMHEAPEVPNYGPPHRGPRLLAGMVIAIEPMINIKGDEVFTQPDGWGVLTKTGTLSAHFEHTVAITPDGPEILTKPTIV